MSGQTPLQVYEISKFTGINIHDNAAAIPSDQFTVLTNATTQAGSITVDAVDALINMPAPVGLVNTVIGLYNEVAWNANSAVMATTYTEQGFRIMNYPLNVGDSVGVAAPFTLYTPPTGNDYFSVNLYADSSGVPGTSIAGGSAVNLGWVVTASATPSGGAWSFYATKEIIASASAASGAWWVTVKGSPASGNLYAYGSTGTAYTTATAAKTWATGAANISCLITKNSLAAGNSVLNIFPFICAAPTEMVNSVSASATAGSVSAHQTYQIVGTQTDLLSFCRLRVDDEPNYKGSIAGLPVQWGTNRYIDITGTSKMVKYNDFNLIDNGAYYLASPETQNGVLLDYGYNQNWAWGSAYGMPKYRRKFSSAFFNGYLVPARVGSPCSYNFNLGMSASAGTSANYAIQVNPIITMSAASNPKGVLSYNNFLMFYNLNYGGTSYPYRMYFSTAGMVDAFASTQYENLSDGEEILWVEEWYGSLIIFFTDKIKRYTGTPGNATLETIAYFGVPCAEAVIKSEKGIFFVSNAGFYMYNGTFQRIFDTSTTFDNADMRKVSEDGWMGYDPGEQEVYFYPGYSGQVNIFNSKHNFFRSLDYTPAGVTGGLRIFNYYHNTDLKCAISYPGITHVSQVAAGTTYKNSQIKSGWIDVDKGEQKQNYEQKKFDRAMVEFDSQTSGTFDFTMYFDDGEKVEEKNIPMTGKQPGVISRLIRLDKSAKLCMYQIDVPAQGAQLKIHRIKIYYDSNMLR